MNPNRTKYSLYTEHHDASGTPAEIALPARYKRLYSEWSIAQHCAITYLELWNSSGFTDKDAEQKRSDWTKRFNLLSRQLIDVGVFTSKWDVRSNWMLCY